MRQIGFLVDTRRCIGCHSCRVACQVNNGTSPLVNWRQVSTHQKGAFPDVSRHFLSLSCNHCARPACIEACPVLAISKHAIDGVVYIDADTCNGCARCVSACPYGAPRKDGDKVSKCDFCRSRLDRGRQPFCVETCVGGALHFGFLDEMETKAGGRPLLRELEGFPSPEATNPATRFIV